MKRDLGPVAPESATQKTQTLHGVEPIHGLLELQMGVVAFEKRHGLVHDVPPLIRTELVDLGQVMAKAAPTLKNPADAVVRLGGQ